MLESFYSAEAVEKVLIPTEEYKPFPRCGEPNSLSDELREALIAAGEKALSYNWPICTAMDYITGVRTGNRQLYEGAEYRERRNKLVALMDAEYAECKGRFIPQIINGMWAIMDEATWVIPAHNGEWYVRHGAAGVNARDGHFELPNFDDPIVIDLFAAGTAGLLSHAYYLFKEQLDAVSPLILRRLELLIQERILDPFMKNEYWWTGLGYYNPPNNWNPWIISNVLACYGYVCKDNSARAAAIARACQMLDRFLGGYHADGGCDEGPNYWGVAGASLYDCLSELGGLMGGAFDVCYHDPLVQNIGRYIYRAHIAGPYFTNYADAPKFVMTSSGLIYRFGKIIQDDAMVSLAVALYQMNKAKRTDIGMESPRFYRHMQELLGEAELAAEAPRDFPLVEDVYLDGLQQAAARQCGGSAEGLYLSAKGGTNGESHNHNDVGSFILFSDGEPAVVDLGSGQYSGKTFGPHRYEIPQMQSSYHNLPEINGVMQKAGKTFAAANISYSCENGVTVFSEDIAGTYPEEAGVSKWQRTFTFDRGAKRVTVQDEAAFTADANHVETMFVVAKEPSVQGNVAVISVENGRDVRITCEGAVHWEVDDLDVTYDVRLAELWDKKVWRLHAVADCGGTLQQSFSMEQV